MDISSAFKARGLYQLTQPYSKHGKHLYVVTQLECPIICSVQELDLSPVYFLLPCLKRMQIK